MGESGREPEKKPPLAQIARYSEIGFIIPGAVLAGLILGKILDHYLHTTWLYIAGTIFGAVVGFVQMILMAIRSTRDEGK
ncbi:MAG TPA: AtpZ/AtpI family protein [Terriglobales bacterium]|nr:AtpZ/AtpI family protein [Terriglobales bacterium]